MLNPLNIPATIPCPNHAGAFDCNPFCPLCFGKQEMETNMNEKLVSADAIYLNGKHYTRDAMQHLTDREVLDLIAYVATTYPQAGHALDVVYEILRLAETN